MPEKADVDWKAAQRDRDAGMSGIELAKKYHVSNPTIYTHTHAASSNGQRSAAKTKPQRKAANGAVDAGMTLAEIIAGLKKRRDALTVAIEALEG